MELLLQRSSTNSLTLRERRQGQRQSEQRSSQNQTQVHREGHARVRTQPGGLLKTDQDQRGQDHDRGCVQDTRDGGFADSEGGSLLTLAQTLEGFGVVAEGLALSAVCVREDGVHVDAAADFLATHEEDVQGGGTGDGGEGDETGENQAGVGGDALEAGHEGVQTQGDGAGGGDGHEVGFGDLGGGEWGGLVGVGIVDGDVERLVTDLPEKSAGRLGGNRLVRVGYRVPI